MSAVYFVSFVSVVAFGAVKVWVPAAKALVPLGAVSAVQSVSSGNPEARTVHTDTE